MDNKNQSRPARGPSGNLKERATSRVRKLLAFDRSIMETGSVPGDQDEVQLNLFSRRYRHIIGVDEVGRGCLAGPVMASAVLLDRELPDQSLCEELLYLDDSKVVSAARREVLAGKIRELACYGVGYVSNQEIDSINILQASLLAMERAVLQLIDSQKLEPSSVVVAIDGGRGLSGLSGSGFAQLMIPGGDKRSACIAAASVVAKVLRDNYMIHLSEKFPHYDWKENKGYPSRAHVAALGRVGPSSMHRQSFTWKH